MTMGRYLLNIRVKAIAMKPFGREGRQPVHFNELSKKLVSAEAVLRKQAYKNSPIKTGEAFFNDSDMGCNYHLLIVYSKYPFTPLLTARYYSDEDIISGVLKGDDEKGNEFSLKNKHGIFLIDRMCANTASSIYRRRRSYINFLFYSMLLMKNGKRNFFAMARKEKGNKLLKKYLRLGLRVKGSMKHKGREHWLLRGTFKEGFMTIGMSFVFRMVSLAQTWMRI